MIQEKLFSHFLQKQLVILLNGVETVLSVCNLEVDSNAL